MNVTCVISDIHGRSLVVDVFDDSIPGPPVLFMEVKGPKLSEMEDSK